MRSSRFTEGQIIAVLAEPQLASRQKSLAEARSIDATHWKAKFVPKPARLCTLEDENLTRQVPRARTSDCRTPVYRRDRTTVPRPSFFTSRTRNRGRGRPNRRGGDARTNAGPHSGPVTPVRIRCRIRIGRRVRIAGIRRIVAPIIIRPACDSRASQRPDGEAEASRRATARQPRRYLPSSSGQRIAWGKGPPKQPAPH